MRLFDNTAQMRETLGAHKKWDRALEAIALAPSLPAGVTYSIGDSLTYRRADAAALATDNLIGRRRYHSVLAAVNGDLGVEVARKVDCAATSTYSDLTDRQEFTGPAALVNVPAGAVLVADIDEAARVLHSPHAEAVLLQVTVEGASFHNK